MELNGQIGHPPPATQPRVARGGVADQAVAAAISGVKVIGISRMPLMK